MSIEYITVEKALTALEEVVAEKGADYRYEKLDRDGLQVCAYIDHGAPSCIVGHVLVRLGVTFDELLPYNIGYGVHAVALDLGLPIEQQALNALGEAQELQDDGAPWRIALDHAREAVS